MHPFEKFVTCLRNSIVPPRLAHALQVPYIAFLETITLGKGLPRCINNEPAIRIAPKYRFVPETYEPSVCAWVKERVKPGDVIFDVGAQFGVYALLGARWVAPGGRIFAFEPSPETLSVLTRNVALNKAQGIVEVVPAAVGSDLGTATMFIVGTHDHNTLASAAMGLINPLAIEVSVITLDTFSKERGVKPRLVKIDTEGWELHVMRGAVELLKADDILFVVEMHPYAWEGAGYGRDDMENFLREHHLEAVPLTGQTDALAVYGDTFLRRVQ